MRYFLGIFFITCLQLVNRVLVEKFPENDFKLDWSYSIRAVEMQGDFFDPTPEKQIVVLMHRAMLRNAEKLIESCEHCNPENAEIPFDNILDRLTDSDPSVTDYILEQPATCPNCRRDIMEQALVEPRTTDQ